MARLNTTLVRMGDSLQAIAARELGDAAAWRELVALNGLVTPYLVPSAAEADRQPGALLWGDLIRVPARATTASAVTGEDALGQDVALQDGALVVGEGGDLATVLGGANLGQALRHRVLTPYGSFLPHPTYGCELHGLLGLRNDPVRMVLAAGLCRRAMLRDPRVVAAQTRAAVRGDALGVDAAVTAANSDTPFDASAVFLLPR